jgi:hypothetical protein
LSSALLWFTRIGVNPSYALHALVNTSQQVGGAVGTALLNTIAATATANYLITHHGAVQADPVHGYRLAFAVSAVVLAAGFVAAFLLIRAGRDDLPDTHSARPGNDNLPAH